VVLSWGRPFVADAPDVAVVAAVAGVVAGAVADVVAAAADVAAVADDGAPKDPGAAGRRSGTGCSGVGAADGADADVGADAGVAGGGGAVGVNVACTVVGSHNRDVWVALSRGGVPGHAGARDLAGLGGRARVVVAGAMNTTRIAVGTEAGSGLRQWLGEEGHGDVHGLDGHPSGWPWLMERGVSLGHFERGPCRHRE
jgi:hypothetical protein